MMTELIVFPALPVDRRVTMSTERPCHINPLNTIIPQSAVDQKFTILLYITSGSTYVLNKRKTSKTNASVFYRQCPEQHGNKEPED